MASVQTYYISVLDDMLATITTFAGLLAAITVQALAVLSAIIPLSFSYRLLKANSAIFSASTVHLLTTIHAFATEGLQIIILCMCLRSLRLFLNTVQYSIGTGSACILRILGCIITIAIHGLAIYAVDIIESRILLGSWKHPYNGACLVLTRCQLLSLQQTWRKSNTTQTKRQRTKRRWSTGSYESLGKARGQLDYLDLDSGYKGKDWTTDRIAASAGNGKEGDEGNKKLVHDHAIGNNMPTPPDSGSQTRRSNSVSWDPMQTVITPGGTERRLSMP
jgi:hypothetical protein